MNNQSNAKDAQVADPTAELGTFLQGTERPYANPIKTDESFCEELAKFYLKARKLDWNEPGIDEWERRRRKEEIQQLRRNLMSAYERGAEGEFELDRRKYITTKIIFECQWYRLRNLETAQEAIKIVNEITPLKYAELRKQQKELEPSGLPAPLKKLIGLVNQGIVSERGMNLTTCTIDRTGKRLFELEGVDCKTHWILDCLADKFTKQNDYEALKNKQDEPLLLPGDIEHFKATNVLTILAASDAPTIVISESEIRRTLGLGSNFPNWKIRNIIFGCRKASVTGRIPLLYRNGRRVVVNTWGTVFSDIIEIEDGVLLARKGIDPQHAIRRSYIFCFGNVSGLIFISNLLQGKFTVLPKEFYHLPEACQNIYRYLSNFRGTSHFGIKQLASIAGYREKDITQLKFRLRDALDRLKKDGFIEHWEPGKGIGRGTTYHVVHSLKAVLRTHSCTT